MIKDIFTSLINNTALLLALSIIYTLVPFQNVKYIRIRKVLTGLGIGLIGIGIMSSPLQFIPGVTFDTRSILISVAALFWGFIPVLITVVMTSIFRIYQGGIGIITGISVIIFSAGIGLLWRYYRLNTLLERNKGKWMELYLFGILTHIGMLVCMFVLPYKIATELLSNITIPVITIYPVGTVLLCLIIINQIEKQKINIQIQESEERLRVTLLSVGDGVITTDKNGIITMINKVGEQVTGWEKKEVIGKSIKEVFRIINEYTREKVEDPVQKVLEKGIIVGLANHTILICKDGTEKPIADSAAPIRDKEGNILGVVLVIRDATEERQKQQEIVYLGYHDSLTGLYNRRFFDEALLKKNNESNLPISIIIGDVNGLKLTNDAFGHEMGDMLLKKMAESIKKSSRDKDIVARWGGDEFILLLPQTDSNEAEKICKKIKMNCSKVKMECIDFSISLGYETKNKKDEEIIKIIKRAEDYMYRRKSIESRSMRGNTINTIIYTLHEKNPREQLHSNRVSEICKKIGTAMNLTEKEISELSLCGLLHDIGKITVSEDILNKQGALTEDEWNEIKRHPMVGYRILSASDSMAYIAKYVLEHHERIDGLGYPNGLKGNEISIYSKILAVADAYDAMISDRPYRKALPTDVVINEFKNKSGTQFDPLVVKILIDNVINLK